MANPVEYSMLSTRQKTHAVNRRTRRGQAIIEGTCMLGVLTLAGVLLIMLGVNLYSIMLRDFKLNLIAYETAKARAASQYWLGELREGVTDEEASDKAKQIAIKLAATAGVALDEGMIEFPATEDARKTTKCKIVNKLSLPFKGGPFESFGGWRNVEVEVVTSDTQDPPVVLALNHHYQSQNGGDSGRNATTYIPCYGGVQEKAERVMDQNTGFAYTIASTNPERISKAIPIYKPLPTSHLGIMQCGTMLGAGWSPGETYAPVEAPPSGPMQPRNLL